MKASSAVAITSVLAAVLCVAEATVSEDTSVTSRGKDKKMEMVKDMHLAFSIVKTLMSMAVMFISPVFQIKGFGLSLINTLVNIGSFLLTIKNSKTMNEHVTQVHRIGVHHPPPHPVYHHHHHPKHPVIVKDQDHWSSEPIPQTWEAHHNSDRGGSWDDGSYYRDSSWNSAPGRDDSQGRPVRRHRTPEDSPGYASGPSAAEDNARPYIPNYTKYR